MSPRCTTSNWYTWILKIFHSSLTKAKISSDSEAEENRLDLSLLRRQSRGSPWHIGVCSSRVLCHRDYFITTPTNLPSPSSFSPVAKHALFCSSLLVKTYRQPRKAKKPSLRQYFRIDRHRGYISKKKKRNKRRARTRLQHATNNTQWYRYIVGNR